MRTVIYARFSSALQNARSVQDQIDLCRERCAREGWAVAEVFSDHAISGAAGIDENQRPGLNAMLARIEDRRHPDGRIDQVLAEATDRIARHQGDALAIRERVTFAGARIFTLSDGEVTEITATFRGLMDAQFRKDLAAKVKRGQRGAIGQGRAAAGIAYGYRSANRLDGKGGLIRGLREIDDDQAEVVRRIFREYGAGQTPRAIAAGLNEDGIPPPQARSGGSSYWRASTIYGDRKRKNGILQNRLYIGELVFNRTRKVTDPRTRKTLIVANPESAWQVEEVPQLRIVSAALWKGAQERLGAVQIMKPAYSRAPRHMLSGLARCGCCGGAWVIRGPARWGCARHREGGAHACPNGRTISTAKMEKRVLAGLQDRLLDPALVEIYVREYHAERARLAADTTRTADRVARDLAKARAKVGRLVAAIADGAGEFEEVRTALADAKAEVASLEAARAEAKAMPVIALHPHVIGDYRDQVARLNAALAENPQARLEAIPQIRALIETITLTPKGAATGLEIEVTGRLTAILGLATGKSPKPYVIGGAGEGIRSIPQFLRAAV